MNKNPRRENLKPFKKGESGNPKGRRPKLPELDILLAEVLSEETNGVPAAKQILTALKKRSLKTGSEANRAAEILLDRGFGKVVQAMEFKGASFEATVFVLPNGREVQI